MKATGTIKDAATGLPLSGAMVTLLDGSGAPTTTATTTGMDGTYSLDTGTAVSPQLMVSYVGFLSGTIAAKATGGDASLTPGSAAASTLANKTPVSLTKKISTPILVAGIVVVVIIALVAAYSVAKAKTT